MKDEPIEVLNLQPNAAVVRCPGRRYPGIVVQGDTLHSLYRTAANLSARLRELGASPDDVGDAHEIAERLEEFVTHYQDVLNSQKVDLPYPTPVSRCEVDADEQNEPEDVLPGLDQGRARSAKVWDYSPSLSTLRILLRDEVAGSYVLLSLHGCERVRFRCNWEPASISAQRSGDHLEVTDGASLYVRCRVAYLSREFRDFSEIPSGPLDHG
jgi:hypothetical protein